MIGAQILESPGRRPRVELRLRVTCSAPSPEAEAAWMEFLTRILRKRSEGM